MDKIVIESSSDEDDTYTNSVARLRALKKKRLEDEKLAKLASAAVTNKDNAREIDDVIIITSEVVPNNNESDIETEIRNTRSRINKEGRGKIRNRGKTRGRGRSNFMVYPVERSTRRRSLINNIECDVEIIPLKDIPNPVSTYNKDDIIPLSSDDDACDDDDNYEIGIKVFWRSVRLDRLNMRRHDTFLKIFQHYADLEKVSVDEILIMRNDKVINCDDTPASLNLSVIDILDGGIVSPGMHTLSSKDKENKEDNKNDACNIKIQTANKKQSLTFSLKKNQQFRTLFSYCALKLGENENNLKLYFDGEQISPTDTPESLDMEGEACIDLRILSA